MPIVANPTAIPNSTPTDATSSDGHLRAVVDPKYGGVKLLVDYTLSDPLVASLRSPFTCTVYRTDPDGTVSVVRGSDPYRNYSARGWLYDIEAPLGVSVQYYVIPVNADGTAGRQSSGAAVTTSVPSEGLWLVALDNPELSIQGRSSDGRDGSYPANTDVQKILDSPFPAATISARGGLSVKQAVLTQGQAEFKAMKKIVDAGFIQRKSTTWERPDGYFLILDVAVVARNAFVGAEGWFEWDLTLQEWGRPDTAGQSVVFPGQSINARKAKYPTFNDVPARTWDKNFILENDSSFTIDVSGWNTAVNNTPTLSSSFSRAGTNSMKLDATASGDMSVKHDLPSQLIIPNQAYEMDAWVLSDVGGPVYITMLFTRSSGGNVQYTSPATTVGPVTWSALSAFGVAPADVSGARVYVGGTAPSASANLYYDIIRFGDRP